MTAPAVHTLRWSVLPGATVAECACGAWRREATLETVTLTGLPRDEALRLAWLDHERDAQAPDLDTASPALTLTSTETGVVGPAL